MNSQARFSLVLVAFLGWPLSATAFVTTKTCYPEGNEDRNFVCEPGEAPKAVCWERTLIPFRIHERGSNRIQSVNPGLPFELENAVIAGFEAWNEADCTSIAVRYDGQTATDTVGYTRGKDNQSVVVWRDTEWPYASRTAFALTSVHLSPTTGIIQDADIELNTAHHVFTVSDDELRTRVDVQNTVAHEVGHFLGLDHSSETDSTMFKQASQGELTKRSLSNDDLAGLCSIYRENGSCRSPYANLKPTGEAGCCAIVREDPRSGRSSVFWWFGVICLWVYRKQRSRVRSASSPLP